MYEMACTIRISILKTFWRLKYMRILHPNFEYGRAKRMPNCQYMYLRVAIVTSIVSVVSAAFDEV